MQIATGISVVLAVGVAIVAVATLRHVPSGGESEATDAEPAEAGELATPTGLAKP